MNSFLHYHRKEISARKHNGVDSCKTSHYIAAYKAFLELENYVPTAIAHIIVSITDIFNLEYHFWILKEVPYGGLGTCAAQKKNTKSIMTFFLFIFMQSVSRIKYNEEKINSSPCFCITP